MATLKEYAGVLSHHVKLIADSNIGPDKLHELHASGVFSTLLSCPEPRKVDRESLHRVLMVRDERPVETLRDLCHRKLEQAARARERDNMGGATNWFDCMEQASELLRAIYQKLEQGGNRQKSHGRIDAIWEPLSTRYYREASALLLLKAYDRTCKLEEAHSILVEAMKSSVPCHVCHWNGRWGYSALQCKACGGKKLLATNMVTCPDCQGSGVGDAYIPADGGTGSCLLCLNGRVGMGKILVDSLNKPVSFDPVYILKLPTPL